MWIWISYTNTVCLTYFSICWKGELNLYGTCRGDRTQSQYSWRLWITDTLCQIVKVSTTKLRVSILRGPFDFTKYFHYETCRYLSRKAEFQVHISFGDEGDFLNNKDIYIDYPPDLTLITKPNIKPGWYEIYKPEFIHLRSWASLLFERQSKVGLMELLR